MANVLIGGGTGLVGTRLSELLTAKGHQVMHLSRSPKSDAAYPTYKWDTKRGYIDPEAVEKAEYIINLAGAGIADQRWTDDRKKVIISSRVETTRLLIKAMADQGKTPKAYISASAIGYYGDTGERIANESSDPGQGFLPESCMAWENAIHEVDQHDWRKVIIRVGVVLSTQGGALEKMITPMKLRAGAYFGDGQQYFSWVHIDDLCRLFIKAVEDDSMQGIYNGVAPNPVRNKQLAYDLKEAMDVSALIMPAPAFAMRMAMGEMADVVLDSTRVAAKRTQESGFRFRYPDLVPALKDVIEQEK